MEKKRYSRRYSGLTTISLPNDWLFQFGIQFSSVFFFLFFLEEEKKKKISLFIDVIYFVNDLQLTAMNGEDLYSSFPSNEILSEIEIGKR